MVAKNKGYQFFSLNKNKLVELLKKVVEIATGEEVDKIQLDEAKKGINVLGGKVEKIVYIDRNKKFNLFECSIPIEDFMGVDNYIRNYKIDLINDH